MAARDWGKFILYLFLFVVAAVAMLFVFAVLHFFTSFILWLIVPPGLVYGMFIFLSLVLFGILLFWARRKRWGWLQAMSLGGASIPGLFIVLILLGPLLPRTPRDEKPNQRQSQLSPSGKYVLTVPIERSTQHKGPFGYGEPFWHVTISDPNGSVRYRDEEDKFAGIRNVYWVWGEADRAWLYDSDDGSVYVYECTDGVWQRDLWGHGKTGHVSRDITPPENLYPRYASGGPVRNLGTPWTLSGLSGSDPNTAAMFRNARTGEFMILGAGETKNGVALIAASWDRQEAVVEINGKQLTLTMPSHR